MADDQAGSSRQDAANGDQQIVKAERKPGPNQADEIKSMLQAMALQQHKQGMKEQYEFWETQPVTQFNEDPTKVPVRTVHADAQAGSRRVKDVSNISDWLQQEDGPIDAPKTVQDVRQEPYPLPDT